MLEWTVQKLLIAVLSFAVTCASAVPSSSSITAELAKKCRSLAIQAYPTQPAGVKSRFEEQQRAYFRECVAKWQDVNLICQSDMGPKHFNVGRLKPWVTMRGVV
jgi:hypothetical protein